MYEGLTLKLIYLNINVRFVIVNVFISKLISASRLSANDAVHTVLDSHNGFCCKLNRKILRTIGLFGWLPVMAFSGRGWGDYLH